MSRRCPLREHSLKSLAAALFLAAACSHPTPPATPAAPATVAPSAEPTPTPTAHTRPGRVALIVMENHSYGQIIGNPQAPYLNELAHTGALATHYSAVAHPSLPNYLALIGGGTFGVTSDCTSCRVDAPNLGSEMDRSYIGWSAFMEAQPKQCFFGAFSGRYAKKHNPWAYFDNLHRDVCLRVDPLTSLDDSKLTDFTWITPDLCNDMHDCSVATGDAFLRRTVPGLLRGLGPRGALFITFDEGTTNNRVVTIAAGDGVRPGTYAGPYTHYSLLRTIEERFGLPLLGRSASAASMRAMFK